MRKLHCLLAILAAAATLGPLAARADWKLRAVWCVSELTTGDASDVVGSLTNHQNAHQRYCEACSGGADQYDSVLACYRGEDERAVAAREEIADAGRQAVNDYLRERIPACCK